MAEEKYLLELKEIVMDLLLKSRALEQELKNMKDQSSFWYGKFEETNKKLAQYERGVESA